MQLTKTKTFRRRSERTRKITRRRVEPGPAAEPRPAAEPNPAMSAAQIRARRGSGPEDRALYSCECGFAWTGEVTASPSCPHCGQPQAW